MTKLQASPGDSDSKPVSYELENFELEMELATGWKTVRANEHEVAAFVLADRSAVQTMLAGSEISATQDGRVWRCRLTPKSWLTKDPSHV